MVGGIMSFILRKQPEHDDWGVYADVAIRRKR
jgi:hypothetical protein